MSAVQDHFNADGFRGYDDGQQMMDRIKALPPAEAASSEEYEETDGVITIEKQSAKDVGEIKHIVIRSPNYTRYFYNESMPTSAEAVQKWIPVSEGLPKEEKTVLTCDARGGIVFGRYSKGKWYWEAEACADYWARDDSVIAWMPRPEPYKGGDDDG